MTVVYGWYLRHFGAKDAFRIVSYGPFSHAGGNIAWEFSRANFTHGYRECI
jgi:hypothetical protein